jgi:hypothetical protein
MPTAHAEATGLITAPAPAVYAILADYRRHAEILPPEHFADFAIEAGGQGAGTIFRVVVIAAGRRIPIRMQASEPQPGRVLQERALESDMTTTFTVDPAGDGGQCTVRIATDWTAKPGPAGWLDRLLTPVVMGRIYREQLRRLARDVVERSVGGVDDNTAP